MSSSFMNFGFEQNLMHVLESSGIKLVCLEYVVLQCVAGNYNK
jgi:hypothetical protein